MPRLLLFIPLFVALLSPLPATAHPLGNYSINQYSVIDLRGERPQIHYQLDIAEIPSFREMDIADTDLDDTVSEEELRIYIDKRAPGMLDNLELTLNGATIPLALRSKRVDIYEGMGSMPVFALQLRLEPETWTWPGTDEETVIDFRSYNHQAARGYRESYVLTDGRFAVAPGPWNDDPELKYVSMVLTDDKGNPLFQSFYNRFRLELSPGPGLLGPDQRTGIDFAWTATAQADDTTLVLLTSLEDASIPETPVVAQAVETPAKNVDAQAANSSPATITRSSNGNRAKPAVSATSNRMLSRVSDVLRTKELTFPMVIVALLVSMVLGMGHAFSPGHGKTVMAAYLIGERGTAWHAFILGIIVTVTHVWSILALGMVSLYFTDYFSEEQFTFWTGLVSGAVIVLLGLVLFRQRFMRYVLERYGTADAHAHDHEHDHGHSHDHTHQHDHDHAHHHHDHTHEHHHDGLFAHSHSHVVETEDGSPPTYRSIFWLGISGGIVPCPAAFIVLMLAINLGRLPLGLLLILSFSVGLAAVLVAIGIAVVRASGHIRQRIGDHSALLLALPVVSSVLITALGLWLVLWTLIQHEIILIPTLA